MTAPLHYVDVSAAVHRRAGLGRYAESLIRAMNELAPDRIGLFYNRESGIHPIQGLDHLPTRTVRLGYKPWRMLVWLGQLSHIGWDRFFRDTLTFHATEHLLLPLHSVPTVLTVHDLIFRRFPQYHKPLNRWYLNLTMPLYVKQATAIIAISQATKQDLISAYGVPADKIRVVYEAADPRFKPQAEHEIARVRSKYSLPERYILFVGTIEPRKNLPRLLEAYRKVHRAGLTDALVVVGKRGWLVGDFFRKLEDETLPPVILPGFVSDEDLPALYAGAQALAFPSLFEGFGLPMLEAMACGTPVVASRAGSLPEIGGDAAVYFDPESIEEMAEALERVLTDAELAEHLRRKGLARAKQFSWRKAARETLDIYTSIRGAAR